MAAYISIDTKRPPHELLSNREFQVMRLIASGKTVSAIASNASENQSLRFQVVEKCLKSRRKEP